MEPLEKVLIIASAEESREASFAISEFLRGQGYSIDLCNDGEESKIKADKLLEEDGSVAGYKGIVFLDDGGDVDACVALAKRADKEVLAIGGLSVKGCLILSKAGLLKDKYLCDGLPDDFYEGSKKVNSPSVRSDNVVTAVGNCAEGFAVLVLDCLGGKIKRIVRSEERELPGKAALIIDEIARWSRYWPVAQKLSEKGGKLAIADWKNIDLDHKRVATCLVMDPSAGSAFMARQVPLPQSVWFRQPMDKQAALLAVKALENAGCRNVNSSRALRMAADEKLVAQAMSGIVEFGKGRPGTTCLMGRSGGGWEPVGVSGGFNEHSLSVARRACVAFQSVLDDPDEVNELGIVLSPRGQGTMVVDIQAVPQAPPVDPLVEPRRDRSYRWMLERELAHEGIWLQPDGRVAIEVMDEISTHDAKAAVLRLQRKAAQAAEDEIKAERGGNDKDIARIRRGASRARHRLRLLCELLSLVDEGKVKTAGLYDSDISGPYAHLDLPYCERVMEYKEGDDWLRDREKAISDQPRYNPEYNENGFYFVWMEPRREPYYWSRILQGDGVYPARSVLMQN